jgi:hypothetical protein
MTRRWNRAVLILGALLADPGAGHAAAPDEPERGKPPSLHEFGGLELMPLWMNLGDPPRNSISLLSAGPAATLRPVRLVWHPFTWTPLQATAGWGRVGTHTILILVGTEIGARFKLVGQRFELGLAGGWGVVSMAYAGDCDADCVIGGAPILFSPVVRYRLPDMPFDLAAHLRALIPTSYPNDYASFGYHRGRGACLLAGIDMTFGHF